MTFLLTIYPIDTPEMLFSISTIDNMVAGELVIVAVFVSVVLVSDAIKLDTLSTFKFYTQEFKNH